MGSPENHVIVEATVNDIDRLVRLIRDSFADVASRFALTPESCPKHPSNCTREWVETDLQRGVRYFILIAAGTAVGCVGVEKAPPTTCERLPENGFGKVARGSRISQPSASDNAVQNRYLEAYLEQLAVLPEHRGKGYGTRLTRYAMDQAKTMGSVEFIEKASGIKQRYAYVKEGILDVDRMCPTIPERPDDALSDQAEIAVHAARRAMDAAGKTAAGFSKRFVPWPSSTSRTMLPNMG